MKYVLSTIFATLGTFVLTQMFTFACLVILRSLLSTGTPWVEMLINSAAFGTLAAVPTFVYVLSTYIPLMSKEQE